MVSMYWMVHCFFFFSALLLFRFPAQAYIIVSPWANDVVSASRMLKYRYVCSLWSLILRASISAKLKAGECKTVRVTKHLRNKGEIHGIACLYHMTRIAWIRIEIQWYRRRAGTLRKRNGNNVANEVPHKLVFVVYFSVWTHIIRSAFPRNKRSDPAV